MFEGRTWTSEKLQRAIIEGPLRSKIRRQRNGGNNSDYRRQKFNADVIQLRVRIKCEYGHTGAIYDCPSFKCAITAVQLNAT